MIATNYFCVNVLQDYYAKRFGDSDDMSDLTYKYVLGGMTGVLLMYQLYIKAY